MGYPKIGLEVNLDGREGRWVGGIMAWGKGKGQKLITRVTLAWIENEI